jgi:hypothetical protein
MMSFTGVRDDDDEIDSEENSGPDRGYFVGVKTLSAALLGPPRNRSLAGLTKLLDVPTKKVDSEEHGGPLTLEYIRYGMRDVQATWECFDALAKRFEDLRGARW